MNNSDSERSQIKLASKVANNKNATTFDIPFQYSSEYEDSRIRGQIALLNQAKTIRDFDNEKDRAVLETIMSQSGTENGIKTEQHRLLIFARK